MLAVPLAAALGRRNIHYSWVVAFTTFLAMLATAGAMAAPGVFLVPLQKEFGWSSAEISVALAVRFALYGLMGPFAAAFLNHFGLRRVMMTALCLVGGALLVSLRMQSLSQLLLLWGVVVGLGTGLTAAVLGATVATRWFSQRRGLVMGLLAASVATGQLVFLPALASLSERYGWRTAMLLVIGALALVLVMVALLMRDRPGDLGLLPFGAQGAQPAPPPKKSFGEMLVTPMVVLREAVGSGTFWVLFGTFFICGASTNGLVQMHFISLCGDYGLAAVSAAGVLALMGVFDFFGTIGSGWLSDRFDNRWLLFWYYGLRGLALISLPFGSFTVYGLSPFAVFYGLDWVATVPPTVKLTTERFGPERANVVFGWIFAGHQLGAATAAWGAGLTRTLTQSYLPAFFAAGVLCVIAALMMAMLAKSHPRRACP